MGVPHMSSYCCCMGLEMGSKFIGFVHLAISITMIIVCSVFASSAHSYVGTIEDEDLLYTTWYKVAVTVAVATSVHVLLAVTLIYSAYKRNTTGLRLWVWVMCILFLAAIGYIVVELALHGPSGSGSDIFLSFLAGLVFFSILAYSILCVHSFFLMLRSAEDFHESDKNYY